MWKATTTDGSVANTARSSSSEAVGGVVGQPSYITKRTSGEENSQQTPMEAHDHDQDSTQPQPRVHNELKVDARIIKVLQTGKDGAPPPVRVRWVGSVSRQLFVIMPCRPVLVASKDIISPPIQTNSSNDTQNHDDANYQMDIITDEDWNISLRWMTILVKRCSGVEDWETARGLAGGLIRTLKDIATFEWLYSSWDRVTVADWCKVGWTDESEEFEAKTTEEYTIGIKNTNLCLDVCGSSRTPGDTVDLHSAKSPHNNITQRFLFKRKHPHLPIGRLHCQQSDLVLEIERGKRLIQVVADPDFDKPEQLFDLSACFLSNGRTIKKGGGRILVGGMPLEVFGEIRDLATVTLGDMDFRDSFYEANVGAKGYWSFYELARDSTSMSFGTLLKSAQKLESVKDNHLTKTPTSVFEPITPNSKQGFIKCIESNLYLQLEPDKPLIQTALDKTKISQLFDLCECFDAGNGEIVPGRILANGKAMEVTHVNGNWVYLEGKVLDESELEPPEELPRLGKVIGEFEDPWDLLWKLKECVKRRLDVFRNATTPGSTVGIWTPNDDDNCENQKFVFKPIIDNTNIATTAYIGRLQCVESQLYLQLDHGMELIQTNLDESDNRKGQIFDLSGLIGVNPEDGSREFTIGKIHVNGFFMGVTRGVYVGGFKKVEVEPEEGEHDELMDEPFHVFGQPQKYWWNQLWLIEQADEKSNSQENKNNFIITVPEIGYCLDVFNNALDPDAEVGIWTRNSIDNQNQTFTFQPLKPTEERPTIGYLQCVGSQLFLELTQSVGLVQNNQRMGNKNQLFDLSECIKYDEETGERSFVVGRILVAGLPMEVCGPDKVAMADADTMVDDEDGYDDSESDIPPGQLWQLTQEFSASVEIESLVERLATDLFWSSPEGVWMHESALDAGDDAWVGLANVKDSIETWVGADLWNVAKNEGTALFAVKEHAAEVESAILGIKVTD
ncbi:hypothetical protein HDU76_012554 [Blyttiomyces sp. JEL0837]|nr:hypothetical protein HDU76_012554 [Blyttiomyces sp. JEL0837]